MFLLLLLLLLSSSLAQILQDVITKTGQAQYQVRNESTNIGVHVKWANKVTAFTRTQQFATLW